MPDTRTAIPAIPERFATAALALHPGSVYALSRDLRLTYMNPAWFRFARENGAGEEFFDRWRQGTPVLDAVPEVLRDFYRELFEEAMRETGLRRPIQFPYECSSPGLFRLFVMSLYPIESGGGLVVVNSPRVVHAHAPSDHVETDRLWAYQNANGLITQCAHCRCVQDPENPEQWHWVQAWVAHFPENTSHSLCPPCFEHYYPRTAKGA